MIVVVGGHSRNIGKTSVVCGIIDSLRDWDWTALKVTQYGHGECSKDGSDCDCAGGDHPVGFSEEKHPDPRHDSGRYLVAGAIQSYWLRTPQGGLAGAVPQLNRAIRHGGNVIVESNSVLGLLRPDLCLMVLDGGVEDFKPSTSRFLDRADGLVLTSAAEPRWPAVSPALLRGKPRYFAPAPEYRSEDLVRAIKLAAVSADIPFR